MALLTDLTIHPTFDQAKKNKQNLEKINWRIGENKFEKPMNDLYVHVTIQGILNKVSQF